MAIKGVRVDSDVTVTLVIPGALNHAQLNQGSELPSDPSARGAHICEIRKGLPQNRGLAGCLL